MIAARERLVWPLVGLTFLVFFQGFMVAPLLPRLALALHTDLAHAAALIPAYMLPYGVVCLVIGVLADRYGSGRILRGLVVAAAILPALCATATSVDALIVWRALTGLGMGGISPLALALIASRYPYAERGRPIGWIFGAIAGGMAVGATVGPWLEPVLGWRGIFLVVSAASALVAVPAWSALGAIAPPVAAARFDAAALIRGYLALVASRRGATVYAYVFANGVFHSGVFSWLGVYFTQRYGLGPRAIGFALLGYGIPGFLFGPLIGRLADRYGRRGLIRGGLLLAGACALVLAAPLPVLGATLAITALSLGFDLTHPLFAGVVSALDPARTAQAMALNTFTIFIGLGVGSVAFGALYAAAGMTVALVSFGALQLTLAAASLRLHRSWR